MEDIVLTAEKRVVIGKQVRGLRRQGKLPAVIYGHNIQPVAITLDARETSRSLAGITPSHLITISVGKDKHTVLVREKQRHPVQGVLQHIDFLAVSMTEKLRANVFIELIGDAPAVKEFDGLLVTGVEVVEVECLPKDLPERIQVDLSVLRQIGDSLHVRDIQFGSAVDILTDPAEMVVLVTAPVLEEVEAAAEVAAAEPEVIEKGRKEEEAF